VLSPSDLKRYLERIQYAGPRSRTAATLRALHVAHLQNVPFENLSVRRGEPIVLEEKRLFEKVVSRRRGGFCYELNGAFAALLEALGFQVSRLAGRVGPTGIDFDHMAVRVELDEPWLADVGFGDCFVEPLRLNAREPQAGGDGRRYRLEATAGGLLLTREHGAAWERQYELGLNPWPLPAFEGGCRHHATSPDSPFTRKTIVSRATEHGRVTLSERKLLITERGVRTETELQDDAAFTQALRGHFGIAL